jgi:two-component system response regulator YesN
VNKCLDSEKNQPSNLNMKKILQFIEDHYADQLSLSDVAEHFHFNPSYLSNYFSTHNKEGFIEYLNKVRIEKASQLLLKDSASISEISGLVGFSDHSYFCKVFKKINGMSPSKFRRKHT